MILTTRKHALAEIRAWWHKVLFALKKLAPKKPKVIPTYDRDHAKTRFGRDAIPRQSEHHCMSVLFALAKKP